MARPQKPGKGAAARKSKTSGGMGNSTLLGKAFNLGATEMQDVESPDGTVMSKEILKHPVWDAILNQGQGRQMLDYMDMQQKLMDMRSQDALEKQQLGADYAMKRMQEGERWKAQQEAQKSGLETYNIGAADQLAQQSDFMRQQGIQESPDSANIRGLRLQNAVPISKGYGAMADTEGAKQLLQYLQNNPEATAIMKQLEQTIKQNSAVGGGISNEQAQWNLMNSQQVDPSKNQADMAKYGLNAALDRGRMENIPAQLLSERRKFNTVGTGEAVLNRDFPVGDATIINPRTARSEEETSPMVINGKPYKYKDENGNMVPYMTTKKVWKDVPAAAKSINTPQPVDPKIMAMFGNPDDSLAGDQQPVDVRMNPSASFGVPNQTVNQTQPMPTVNMGLSPVDMEERMRRRIQQAKQPAYMTGNQDLSLPGYSVNPFSGYKTSN